MNIEPFREQAIADVAKALGCTTKHVALGCTTNVLDFMNKPLEVGMPYAVTQRATVLAQRELIGRLGQAITALLDSRDRPMLFSQRMPFRRLATEAEQAIAEVSSLENNAK